jgi:hypothetical protein
MNLKLYTVLVCAQQVGGDRNRHSSSCYRRISSSRLIARPYLKINKSDKRQWCNLSLKKGVWYRDGRWRVQLVWGLEEQVSQKDNDFQH